MRRKNDCGVTQCLIPWDSLEPLQPEDEPREPRTGPDTNDCGLSDCDGSGMILGYWPVPLKQLI